MNQAGQQKTAWFYSNFGVSCAFFLPTLLTTDVFLPAKFRRNGEEMENNILEYFRVFRAVYWRINTYTWYKYLCLKFLKIWSHLLPFGEF